VGTLEFVSTSVEHLLGVKRELLLQDLGQFWACILEEDKPAFVAAVETATQDAKISQLMGQLAEMHAALVKLQSKDELVAQR
jgi:hypothetical protein